MTDRAISDGSFAEFLRQGKLMGAKCAACEAVFVPPRTLCPQCHRAEMQWVAMSGGGRLVAYTCISIGPPWMAAQGFGRDNPYCSAVVELDEGPRVVARIEGVDAKQPESIRIGMRLAAQFATCDPNSYATPPLIFKPV
jgi:uncharacterized OB-fold protein